MADRFLLEIVTPSRRLLSEEVEEVTAPGEVGEFGVLAGHMHFFALLKAGELTYKTGREARRVAVGRGYAEVGPERTTILVDSAESAEEIDLTKAREDQSEAEGRMKSLGPADPAYQSAKEAFDLAEARIMVKEGKSG